MANFAFSVLPLLEDFDLNVLSQLRKIGVDTIHYDIIDNQFYHGRGYHGEWIEEIHQLGFQISVHIMASDCNSIFQKLKNKPIDSIAFQVEPFSTNEITQKLQICQSFCKQVGVAIEFDTSLDFLSEISIRKQINYLILMSVKPGHGGQKFNPSVISNLKAIKELNDKSSDQRLQIHLDGGVNLDVVKMTKNLVDTYVSGTFFLSLPMDKKNGFLQLIKNENTFHN